MPVTTPSFVYPTNMELTQIDQDFLPVLSQSNPIFELFPLKERDASVLKWEQRDNYLGLMQARGQQGEYPSIQSVAINAFELTPGRYGEHALIMGKEIEDRRGFGQVNAPIDVRDIVVERLEQTATRHFNLMSYICWTLITSGYYSIVGPNNAVVKRDAVIVQNFDSVVNGGSYWSTASSSTPLADFRAVQLFHRGHSIAFNSSSTAWMNLKTKNYMLSNTNTADLFGRRNAGLETIEGVDALNTAVLMKDDLPKVTVYDEGYKDSNNVFQPFIPDGIVVLMGKRLNGAALGEFTFTRNADNGSSSAPLVKVVEKGTTPNSPPPMAIEVYRGFNGGPRLFYGNAIVVMKVA